MSRLRLRRITLCSGLIAEQRLRQRADKHTRSMANPSFNKPPAEAHDAKKVVCREEQVLFRDGQDGIAISLPQPEGALPFNLAEKSERPITAARKEKSPRAPGLLA